MKVKCHLDQVKRSVTRGEIPLTGNQLPQIGGFVAGRQPFCHFVTFPLKRGITSTIRFANSALQTAQNDIDQLSINKKEGF